jgi:hypothetical protein
MNEHHAVVAALFIVALAAPGCGSGACQQTPCVPGVPLLQSTCKCVPSEDGGPSLDTGIASQGD